MKKMPLGEYDDNYSLKILKHEKGMRILKKTPFIKKMTRKEMNGFIVNISN